MTRVRKQLPAYFGDGELHYRGFTGPVTYEIQGDPASLRLGPVRLRGSLTASPDVAAGAFHAGEGDLRLQDGAIFRVTVIGHSAGSEVAYFEMRV
jgi:hypothetical protein